MPSLHQHFRLVLDPLILCRVDCNKAHFEICAFFYAGLQEDGHGQEAAGAGQLEGEIRTEHPGHPIGQERRWRFGQIQGLVLRVIGSQKLTWRF